MLLAESESVFTPILTSMTSALSGVQTDTIAAIAAVAGIGIVIFGIMFALRSTKKGFNIVAK